MQALQGFFASKKPSAELKTPVVYRNEDSHYIIRKIKNYRGACMCELTMDDDKIMRPYDALPNDVQKQIANQL